jgi:hypothetical protein
VVRTGWRRSGEEHAVAVHHPDLRLRSAVVHALLIAGLSCGLAKRLEADDREPIITRVRSSVPALTALIERAAGHSATFQRLLTSIQGSNGIVYIETGTCSHGVVSCLRIWMKTAGPNRFLRVDIDVRKIQSDVEVMGAMGHELQHAVEALSESGVTDGASLYNFFHRFGMTDDGRFETTDAIHAGDNIREELRRH